MYKVEPSEPCTRDTAWSHAIEGMRVPLSASTIMVQHTRDAGEQCITIYCAPGSPAINFLAGAQIAQLTA
jgi:hypothetical protein